MKFHGKTLVKPNIELIVIPRGDGDDIVFKAKGIADMTEFDTLCPMPTPPTRIYPGGKKVPDITAPEYQKAITDHAELRFAYMATRALLATDGLEWETVDLSRPATWKNYTDELKEVGLTTIEINRVVQGIMNANCLNEDKIEEARQRFLASLLEAEAPSSSIQEGDQSSTQSGDPVNA